MEKRLHRVTDIVLHPRAFTVAVFAAVVFLLLQDGFFTLDGWAHLANAQLLLELLTGRAWVDGFVQLNPLPVPNWGGHAVLTALLTVFPPLFAEKVHWALLFAALAFGAQRYVRGLGAPRDARAMLLLPVLLGRLFVLGFYNFQWGVAASLWFASWWADAPVRGRTRWPLLFASGWLVWFCHGSCVPLFLLLVLAQELAIGVPVPWRRIGGVLLVSAPVLAALVAFNARFEVGGSARTAHDVLPGLLRLDWSVWYDPSRELPLTLLLGALLVAALVLAFRSGRTSVAWRKALPSGVLAALLLAACFVLPDDTGYASYVVLRSDTMAMLLLGMWACAVVRERSRMLPLLILAAILVTGGRLVLGAKEGLQAAPDREVIVRATRVMRPGDVVLPIWRDDRWIMQHRVDLLGAALPLRLLENYECTKGYFPLVWSPQLPPAFRAQVLYADDRLERMHEHLRAERSPAVDHIVLMGPQADVHEPVVRTLLATADSLGYMLAFAEADVRVWSRRR